jgi:hypothetical protein
MTPEQEEELLLNVAADPDENPLVYLAALHRDEQPPESNGHAQGWTILFVAVVFVAICWLLLGIK